MVATLIIPGLFGSPDGHWQTILQARTPLAYRVEQDDWDAPVLDQWVERLASCANANPGAIAVAHSLGCILVAHAALRMPDIKIGGALLVAPADVDSSIDAFLQLRSFAPAPTIPLPFPSAVVASSNDPFMSLHRAETMAEAWGSELVDIGAAGHINTASGYGWWPDAHDLISRIATRAKMTQQSTQRPKGHFIRRRTAPGPPIRHVGRDR
jgi:predicted alpha/beta hydrolase family esterase